jgi:hypothetical protein
VTENKLVQVEVLVQFAPVSEDGIETLHKAVRITVSGADWAREWANQRTDEIFANVVTQLEAEQDGVPL